jgi:hypothetical protein
VEEEDNFAKAIDNQKFLVESRKKKNVFNN